MLLLFARTVIRNSRVCELSICLLFLSITNVTLSQGTPACPCAGVTTTTVNGTSGSQTSTAAMNWTTVSGTGASFSLSGIFSISMETLTFSIPGTTLPGGTRFCSVTDPVPVIGGNANVGLITSSYDVVGNYLTGYTVTVDVSFDGVSAFGTATVNVSGISYTIVTQTGCILPVELGSFSGQQEGRCATLEWHTLSEKDCDHFTVQKMVDGTFVDIATVNSLHGTSQQQSDYSFTDCDVSVVNYYRLYQTDDNGEIEYLGEMISVGIDRSEPGKLNVVPNPGTNFTCVYTDEDMRTIRIYSSDGRLMSEHSFSEHEQQYCLDIADFPQGVYTVQVQTDNSARSSQLVKQ